MSTRGCVLGHWSRVFGWRIGEKQENASPDLRKPSFPATAYWEFIQLTQWLVFELLTVLTPLEMGCVFLSTKYFKDKNYNISDSLLSWLHKRHLTRMDETVPWESRYKFASIIIAIYTQNMGPRSAWVADFSRNLQFFRLRQRNIKYCAAWATSASRNDTLWSMYCG